MFTGIVEEVGRVQSIRREPANAVLTITASKVLEDVHLGDSIAVCGVCLTVTSFTSSAFTADVMHETLNRSSLGAVKPGSPGSPVNLERAMPANGRFGGHIVSGHIDGTGRITRIRPDGNAIWYTVSATPSLLRYIVEKGSIAIDGISLTVAQVTGRDFSVSIIPHTQGQTTLSDCIGKYVEKLLGSPDAGITQAFLARCGY